MDTQHDLLFAVLAFRAELLDATRFAEVCAAWSADRGTPMAELLVRRGWITAADRSALEHLLAVKLTHHAGDPRAAFTSVEDEPIWRVLTSLGEGPAPSGARETLAHTPVSGLTREQEDLRTGPSPKTVAHVLVSTVPFTPERRERYTLTRLHARGGIGQVWLARDATLGREVALKELRPERARDPNLWARFLEEARITGQLEHPSIVPVYELARRAEDQYPFYTMRFVRGRTLTEALRDYHHRRREGRAEALEFPTLLNAFIGLCQAVAFAHARGVIHRDLKGQNVVLGDFGEVMLLDWGLAKVLEQPGAAAVAPLAPGQEDREGTEAGQVLGTPAYMSPEQAAGDSGRVDRHSDVYGLGAILYELLAGQPPFSGSRTEEILRRVCEEEPTPPRRINPEASRALEAVCRKAMAKDPRARYASATELLHEVQRFLADEPVAAYPDPLPVRARRLARRHRTLVTGAAVLMVSAIVALSAGGVLVARERDEARRQGRFARQAVEDMYTQVAEQWLADQPRMDPLQRRFLEKALDYYERFAQMASTDPVVRREKGQAYHRMGDILRKLGRHPDAEKAYGRAIELLQDLTRVRPGEPQYRHELAHAQNRLGIVLAATGHRREAEASYRRALAQQQALTAALPARPAYRHHLAKTQVNLAHLLAEDGRRTEAETAYGLGLDLLGRLRREAPGELVYSDDLAGGLLGLGRLLQEQDRRDDAVKAFRQAAELLEPLVVGDAVSPRRRELLAIARLQSGRMLRASGRLAQAEPVLTQALALYQALASEFPDRPVYYGGAARSEANLAEIFSSSGRRGEAEAAYRRAIRALETLVSRDASTATQNRRSLALCYNSLGLLLANEGRGAEAERAYRDVLRIDRALAATEPNVPQYRRDLGMALGNFALFLSASRRNGEAEAAYREAQTLYEQLAAEHPHVPDYRRALAINSASLGNMGFDDAEPSYRRAIDLFRALVLEVPGEREDRVGLVRSENNFADYLRKQGRGAEAVRRLETVARDAETLVRDFPELPEYLALQGQFLGTLGGVQFHAGDYAGARRRLEQAAAALRTARQKQPDVAEHTAGLRETLVDLGRTFVALQELAETATTVEDLRAQAVKALREAMELGGVEFDRLAQEPDFAPLRDRVDFRALERPR
jgi:serine/threonine-protein kinase